MIFFKVIQIKGPFSTTWINSRQPGLHVFSHLSVALLSFCLLTLLRQFLWKTAPFLYSISKTSLLLTPDKSIFNSNGKVCSSNSDAMWIATFLYDCVILFLSLLFSDQVLGRHYPPGRENTMTNLCVQYHWKTYWSWTWKRKKRVTNHSGCAWIYSPHIHFVHFLCYIIAPCLIMKKCNWKKC